MRIIVEDNSPLSASMVDDVLIPILDIIVDNASVSSVDNWSSLFSSVVDDAEGMIVCFVSVDDRVTWPVDDSSPSSPSVLDGMCTVVSSVFVSGIGVGALDGESCSSCSVVMDVCPVM